jgi:hypothetical protein
MTNKVKYATVRKYRDVGFNTVPEKEERIRPKTSITLKEKEQRTRTRTSFNIKKKKSIFEKIKDNLKSIFKK